MSAGTIIRLDRLGHVRALHDGKPVPLELVHVRETDGDVGFCPWLLGPDEPELPTLAQSLRTAAVETWRTLALVLVDVWKLPSEG